MSPLDPEQIAQLLKEDEEKKTTRGGSRGPRVDPTEVRQINVWFKLHHHICPPDCEIPGHRPLGELRACWNPDCVDPRNPETDRATMIVAEVKGQWICRYCFLAGYLK